MLNGLYTIFLVLLLSGCKFITPPLNSRADRVQLIVTSSVDLSRQRGDTYLSLRFSTLQPVKVDVHWWPYDINGSAQIEERRTYQLSYDEEQNTFDIQLPIAALDRLYAVKIFANDPYSNKASEYTVTEGGDLDGAYDLMVSRINIPLRTAEIHQHNLIQDVRTLDWHSTLIPDFTCRKNPEEQAHRFSSMAKGNSLKNLSARGFASGTATQHTNYSDVFKLSFNSLQTGDQWKFLYTMFTEDFSFIAPRPPMFSAASLTIDALKDFPEPQLAIPEMSVDIKTTQNLTFKWQAEHLSNLSYVRIQVGRPGSLNEIICYESAHGGDTEIESSLLGDLESGFYDVQLSLVNHVIIPAGLETGITWLLTTSDWKTLRLRVL